MASSLRKELRQRWKVSRVDFVRDEVYETRVSSLDKSQKSATKKSTAHSSFIDSVGAFDRVKREDTWDTLSERRVKHRSFSYLLQEEYIMVLWKMKKYI